MEKGQKFSEWVEEKMDSKNITTARVFLITGSILGFICGTCLGIIIGLSIN